MEPRKNLSEEKCNIPSHKREVGNSIGPKYTLAFVYKTTKTTTSNHLGRRTGCDVEPKSKIVNAVAWLGSVVNRIHRAGCCKNYFVNVLSSSGALTTNLGTRTSALYILMAMNFNNRTSNHRSSTILV